MPLMEILFDPEMLIQCVRKQTSEDEGNKREGE